MVSSSGFESDSRWKKSASRDAETLKNIHVPTNTFSLELNLGTQTVICYWTGNDGNNLKMALLCCFRDTIKKLKCFGFQMFY